MKLWLLRPAGYVGSWEGSGPWDPWYDKAFGFVVRAESEEAARTYASREAGDEKRGGVNPWLHAEYSTCVELLPEGESGIIIQDFAAA